VTFGHLAESEDGRNPLTKVEAFQEFQKDIDDRGDERPVVTELREIGSFRLCGG
jgi:hypothetical protein